MAELVLQMVGTKATMGSTAAAEAAGAGAWRCAV